MMDEIKAAPTRTAQPSFAFAGLKSKVVAVVSTGSFGTGFLADIGGDKYVVTCDHILTGPHCYFQFNKQSLTPISQIYRHPSLDLALIPLLDSEVATFQKSALQFFDLVPLDPENYMGRMVRQVGVRQGGGFDVSSGSLCFVSEDEFEVDTHTEPGQSGSVNVVDDLVLGMHLGSRALKLPVMPAKSPMHNKRVCETTDEELNRASWERMVHMAKFAGARSRELPVGHIIAAHQKFKTEGYLPPPSLKHCGCGTECPPGSKFCLVCGKKFE